MTDYAVLREVSLRLESLVTPRLRSIRLVLAPDVDRYPDGLPGSFRLGVADTSSPCDYAYWRIANILAEGTPVIPCVNPACGRYFAKVDPRQQYCTDACRNRARQSRNRARRKGEVETT